MLFRHKSIRPLWCYGDNSCRNPVLKSFNANYSTPSAPCRKISWHVQNFREVWAEIFECCWQDCHRALVDTSEVCPVDIITPWCSMLIHHLRGWTTGPLVDAVQRRSLTPSALPLWSSLSSSVIIRMRHNHISIKQRERRKLQMEMENRGSPVSIVSNYKLYQRVSIPGTGKQFFL
jgi:hypothetical protein